MSRKSKALEFVGEGFNFNITGRHILITDSMKSYVMEKISKIERFTNRIIDVNVIMDIQKLDQRVDIILKLGHMIIKSHGSSPDMYASIDQAADRIKEQILKYKDKMQDHHTTSRSDVDMNVNVLKASNEDDIVEVNNEIEEENRRRLLDKYQPHRIVSKETKPLKILTDGEAIMKMELSGDAFMIFRGEESHKLKIIYRRNDNNFGVIEPEA